MGKATRMAWYVVSYDLRREAPSFASMDDYKRVHAALRTAADYCWALLSFWIIQTTLTPRQVIEKLLELGAIDDNDGIAVLEITGLGDFRRLDQQEAIDWLNKRLIRR